jgi:hypothetical protein
MFKQLTELVRQTTVPVVTYTLTQRQRLCEECRLWVWTSGMSGSSPGSSGGSSPVRCAKHTCLPAQTNGVDYRPASSARRKLVQK